MCVQDKRPHFKSNTFRTKCALSNDDYNGDAAIRTPQREKNVARRKTDGRNYACAKVISVADVFLISQSAHSLRELSGCNEKLRLRMSHLLSTSKKLILRH